MTKKENGDALVQGKTIWTNSKDSHFSLNLKIKTIIRKTIPHSKSKIKVDRIRG